MFIPGRIEFLGKHTDYCGGENIVCAIDRGFSCDAEPRSDSTVVIENLDTGENISFVLGNDSTWPTGHWANYTVEVCRRLRQNFDERTLKGAGIRFHSNLPKAAGLSSSSALMIMVFAALNSVNDLASFDAYRENITDEMALAEYLGCVENGQSYRDLAGSAGVGTFGGSQDHAAIVLGKAGCLSQFSFSPLRHGSDFDLPDDYVFVVASSGVAAEKTGAALEKYNRVSRMVREITDSIGDGRSLAATISEIGIDEVRTMAREGDFSFSSDDLTDRVEQFGVENFEIIPAAVKILATGNLEPLGEWIDLSHRNAERLLRNQIDETSFLQRAAREMGAVAASAFGAGFGGSVYALVKTTDADQFRLAWQRAYQRQFPQHDEQSEFFITRPCQNRLR